MATSTSNSHVTFLCAGTRVDLHVSMSSQRPPWHHTPYTIHHSPTPYLAPVFSLAPSSPPPQDLDRVLDRVVRCAFASDDRRSLDTQIMIGIGSVIVIDIDIDIDRRRRHQSGNSKW
ncbi:hypothetical protein ACLKA6_009974 [Drosophila palustris]